jgi:membrane protease YdiL (CAAX protease family)
LALGTLVGLGLLLPGVALAATTHLLPRSAGLPPTAFPAWGAATAVVALAEEALLRGVLQPRIAAGLGDGGGIAACALLFAAIHVPLYGPGVLPLDLGVGLVLGWLRLRTGGVAACAVAHVIADLGGWFLP